MFKEEFKRYLLVSCCEPPSSYSFLHPDSSNFKTTIDDTIKSKGRTDPECSSFNMFVPLGSLQNWLVAAAVLSSFLCVREQEGE